MENKIWPVDAERIAKGQYWQKTWKLVEGCTHVSSACDNCWSARETQVRAGQANVKISGPKQDLIEGGRFNGTIRLRWDNIAKPLQNKKPTVYAVWNDLFHENVPLEFLTQVMTVIDRCRDRHIFLILTKRPDVMYEYIMGVHAVSGAIPPENLWLGTSVEDQMTADLRIRYLMEMKGQLRKIKIYISYEPALGPVDFAHVGCPENDSLIRLNILSGQAFVDGRNEPAQIAKLDWLIMGGESGPGARPTHPDAVRSVRDQCAAAGVPFFFKQWGEWAETQCEPGGDLGGDMRRDIVRIVKAEGENDGHFRPGDVLMRRVGKARAGCMLDGKEHKELPR